MSFLRAFAFLAWLGSACTDTTTSPPSLAAAHPPIAADAQASGNASPATNVTAVAHDAAAPRRVAGRFDAGLATSDRSASSDAAAISDAAQPATASPDAAAISDAAQPATTTPDAAAISDASLPAADAAAISDADLPSADAAAISDTDQSCPDSFPRGPSTLGARKLLAVTPSPEGVTMCPNGQVFLARDDGRIVRVAIDDGTLEDWANLPGIEPAGITCDEHDRLFVAVYAVRSGSGSPGVVRIDARDAAPVVLPPPSEASPLAAYNGILAVASHGVYATDSGAGWVVHLYETSPGSYVSEIVARDIPIANGLAYDTARNKLYVASSLDFAVYAFQLAADGTLMQRSKVPSRHSSFFDGVAVDDTGALYVADYSGGQVMRLSDDQVIATLPTPASFAFRGGTLLVTDYRLNQPEAEGGLYAVDLGVCSGQALR
jgi:sugar lactone lactonase YvrE